jgi:hypothetical protein
MAVAKQMEDKKYREDCKGKWYYKLIEHMSDEEIDKSTLTNKCNVCKKTKPISEFVVPAWWQGYQIWREKCHDCHMNKQMKELDKVVKEIPKRFPGMSVHTKIVTPSKVIDK